MTLPAVEAQTYSVITLNARYALYPWTFPFLEDLNLITVYFQEQSDNTHQWKPATKGKEYVQLYVYSDKRDGSPTGAISAYTGTEGVLVIGDKLLILRAGPTDQNKTFASQILLSQSLNDGLDRLALHLQDHQNFFQTLHAPIGEFPKTHQELSIPTIPLRANRLLGFDANGAPSVATSELFLEKLQEMEAKIEHQNQVIEEFKTDIAQEMAQLQADLSTLQKELHTAQSNIITLTDRMDNVQPRVNQLQQDMLNARQRIQTLEDNLTDLSQRSLQLSKKASEMLINLHIDADSLQLFLLAHPNEAAVPAFQLVQTTPYTLAQLVIKTTGND
jgi:uncharacterized phage infection (PIP) family protein YhgE